MTPCLEDSNEAGHAQIDAAHTQVNGHLHKQEAISSHKREASRRTRLYSGARPVFLTANRFHSLASEAVVLSVLGIASFLGTLVRLGLNAINTYNGQPVFPLIWAQMVGCAMMGAATTRSKHIGAIYPHLYVGITTGFCGSTTTFSAWMAQVFEGFAQIDTSSHGGFYNLMAGLSQTFVTLAASASAFTFGTHIGPSLFPHNKRSHVPHDEQRVPPSTQATHAHHPPGISGNGDYFVLHCVTAISFLAMYVCLAILATYKQEWRGIVLFSLIFAPWGTWLRFYLSQINTMERFADFPLGTFSANMIGTAIIAGCTALQFTGPGLSSLLHCQILQGFNDGFCGCLTTVSTFMAELGRLTRRSSYVYAISSWATGQLLLVLLLGSVDFTRGGLGSKCNFS